MKKHSEIDMVVWWGMLPHVQEHAREQLDTSLTPCKAAGACASLLGGSSRVAIQPSAVLSTYSECVGHACFPYSASCTRVGAVQGASPRALFFFRRHEMHSATWSHNACITMPRVYHILERSSWSTYVRRRHLAALACRAAKHLCAFCVTRKTQKTQT